MMSKVFWKAFVKKFAMDNCLTQEEVDLFSKLVDEIENVKE